MKSPKEILKKNIGQYSDSFKQFYEFDVIQSMEEYAKQFISKPCACTEQEQELIELNKFKNRNN